MESSLLNPYSFFLNSDGTYQFETSNNCIYFANFRHRNNYFVDEPLLEEFIYLFDFDTASTSKHDPRIEITLVKLINTFFEKNENCALIFTCDISEELHRPRKIVFNKWFKKHNEIFEKYDYEIPGGDFQYYASLIVHPNNPYKSLMLEESEKLVAAITK